MKLKTAITISIIGASLYVCSNLIDMYLRFVSGVDYFMLGSIYSYLSSASVIFDFLFSLTLLNLFVSFLKSQKKRSL